MNFDTTTAPVQGDDDTITTTTTTTTKGRNPTRNVDGVTLRFQLRQSGKWELHFPHLETRKRERENTHLTDLAKAMEWGEEFYRDLAHKHKRGITANVPSFATAAAGYAADQRRLVEASKGKKSRRAFDVMTHELDSKILPFLGAYGCDEITAKVISEYHKHRRDQWEAQRGQYYYRDVPTGKLDRDGKPVIRRRKYSFNGIDAPSTATMNRDEGRIRKVLQFAVEQGMLTKGEVAEWKKTEREDDERRGAFIPDQWQRIVAFLEERVAKAKAAVMMAGRDLATDTIYYGRMLLLQFVLLLSKTGMRPEEALELRFHDIDLDHVLEEKMPDGQIVYVPCVHFLVLGRYDEQGKKRKGGKTGKRPAVAPATVRAVIEVVRAIHPNPMPDAHVFVTRKGKRKRTYSGKFGEILRKLGITHDAEGNDLTLYSIRHMHITQMIIEHKGEGLYGLAKNCGTSLSQIKKHYDHVLLTMVANRLAQPLTTI